MFQMKKNIISEIVSALFVILFIYASLGKLQDFEKFRVQLGKSPLITAYAGFIAWVIPTVEIVVAFLLILKRFQLIGLFASFTLMVLFTAYIFTILKFSEYIPCSCGGILQNMTWSYHLIFNLTFVALAVLGVLNHKVQMSNDKIIE